VTTDMHIRYYHQPHGGPLMAEAKMVHGGRRLLSSECTVTDAEDRVLARTTATYMLIPTAGMAATSKR
jgi:acyl-coenzyme A thioesterase PaaI-like protein